MRPGVVYVLTSTGFPGLCKVGQTRRASSLRAAEVNAARNYRRLGPWRLYVSVHVADASRVEQLVHKRLRGQRYRLRHYRAREIFRVAPAEAERLIVQAANQAERSPAGSGWLFLAVMAALILGLLVANWLWG